MLKGYYIVYETMNLDKPDGVEKKIISQKNEFCSNGFDMSFHTLKKNRGTFWSDPIPVMDADFIYFRRGTILDIRFICFFKRIKKSNPGCVVFMEIPTYPYDNEAHRSIRRKLALMIDRMCRTHIHKYIDRLVIVNYHKDTLWNIKAINLVNGIDVDSILPQKARTYEDVFNICCIAKFSPWHGYERLIRGLRDYYDGNPDRKVILTMVGTGVEKDKYVQLAEDLNLVDYVIFKGQLTGKELDEEYDRANIGCCSLGRYKSGLEMTSELKSRELMAKGLPMICGCKIDVLEEHEFPFAIYFPNNASNIRIGDVLKKYNEWILEYGEEGMTNRIRDYARNIVNMGVTFMPIVDKAKELCRD